MSQTLSLDQFRTAFHAGGLVSVAVSASGGVFFITARSREGESLILGTTRDKKRRAFRDAGKAVAVVHKIGARHFEVDTSHWEPERTDDTRVRRPDAAERQHQAQQARSHDAWFRRQVQAALDDARQPVDDRTVQARFAQRRAEARRLLENDT